MGYRRYYYEGSVDGLAGLFLEHIGEFRQWYARYFDLGVDELDADERHFHADSLELLDRIWDVGREALVPRTLREAELLDDAVGWFVSEDWDYVPKILHEQSHRWRLHINQLALVGSESECQTLKLTDVVASAGSPELCLAWSQLARGRPISGDSCPFPCRRDDDNRGWDDGFVSWLTAQEVSVVLPSLLELAESGANEPDALLILRVTADALSSVAARGLGLIVGVA